MALTEQQEDALRDLGQLFAKTIEIRDKLKRVQNEITALQAKRATLAADLQAAKAEALAAWEAVKNT